MTKLKFLTNTHISNQTETLSALHMGHNNRKLIIKKPKATPMVTYSQPELIRQNMVGIYEII